MDSIWNMFHHINQVVTTMESIWNPHRFHTNSTWIPGGTYLIFLPKIEQRLKNIKISEEIMYINCIN